MCSLLSEDTSDIHCSPLIITIVTHSSLTCHGPPPSRRPLSIFVQQRFLSLCQTRVPFLQSPKYQHTTYLSTMGIWLAPFRLSPFWLTLPSLSVLTHPLDSCSSSHECPLSEKHRVFFNIVVFALALSFCCSLTGSWEKPNEFLAGHPSSHSFCNPRLLLFSYYWGYWGRWR